MLEPIVGNRTIENAAIAFVMEYERRSGREPQDTHGNPQAPADLVSPPRMIEVKAYGGSARGGELWLEPNQMQAATSGGEFYLYIVENVRQGDPRLFTLRILGGERLGSLLKRAKEWRYFTLPWPVNDYDNTPVEGATNKGIE